MICTSSEGVARAQIDGQQIAHARRVELVLDGVGLERRRLRRLQAILERLRPEAER